MNEFINISGQWPKLTLSLIAPVLALVTGLCWFFSGYCATKVFNEGWKTQVFWKWLSLMFASLGGVICCIILIVLAILKACDGLSFQFFYHILGMILIATVTAFICSKMEKTVGGALAK